MIGLIPPATGPAPRPAAGPDRWDAAVWLALAALLAVLLCRCWSEPAVWPDDGGYLLYHHPGVLPYGDSLFAQVGLVREHFAARRDPQAFLALDRRLRFDWVLLNLPAGQFGLLTWLLYST